MVLHIPAVPHWYSIQDKARLDSTALMEQPNEEAEKEIIYEAEKVEKKATKQDLGMTSKSSTRRW